MHNLYLALYIHNLHFQIQVNKWHNTKYSQTNKQKKKVKTCLVKYPVLQCKHCQCAVWTGSWSFIILMAYFWVYSEYFKHTGISIRHLICSLMARQNVKPRRNPVSTMLSGKWSCAHMLQWSPWEFRRSRPQWAVWDSCVHCTPLWGRWWESAPEQPAECTVYTPGTRRCCRRRRWRNPVTPTYGSWQTLPLCPGGRGRRKELQDRKQIKKLKEGGVDRTNKLQMTLLYKWRD